MNIIKKIIPTTLLVLSMLGLTASFPSHAQTVTPPPTTTSIPVFTCYDVYGISFYSYAGYCPIGSSYSPPPPCDGIRTPNADHGWICTPTTSTTVTTITTTTFPTCYGVDGSVYRNFSPVCGYGTAYTPPPACPNGTLSIYEHRWVCTPTTTTTTPPTTVATTTTTTLKCNTSVNSTTQYKYSGSGSCHDKDHQVNPERWCKKHAPHLNSNGSHVHAYPHPLCM